MRSLRARGGLEHPNRDRAKFTTTPLQSDTGGALMLQYGLDPGDPTLWLYLDDSVTHSRLNASIRVGARFGWLLSHRELLRILPKPLQNSL